MNNDRPQYPTIAQGFSLLLWFVLATMVTTFLFIPFLGDGGSINSTITFGMYVISMALLSLLAMRFSENRPVTIIGDMVSIQPIVYLLIGVLVVANIMIIDPLLSFFPMPEWMEEWLMKGVQKDWASFLTIVIAAPLLEEFVFRGIVLEGFLRNYEPRKAIVWSSVLFGVFHLNPWQFVGATILGIYMGWLYYRTGSLVPSILVHFINNLLGYMAFYYLGDYSSIYQLMPNEAVAVIFFFLAILVVYFVTKLLDKTLPETSFTENTTHDEET